jgi:hypothetical protein
MSVDATTGLPAAQDMTETDVINLRRVIYLTIMSSMDFEEAGHKLTKIPLEPGQEMEIVTMILECCSQEKTYIRCVRACGAGVLIHQRNCGLSAPLCLQPMQAT